jgi:hypothetical protein
LSFTMVEPTWSLWHGLRWDASRAMDIKYSSQFNRPSGFFTNSQILENILFNNNNNIMFLFLFLCIIIFYI